MTLIKTSILSFIATGIKILAALIINKAVAIFIGPAGLALIGQFQNFTQITMMAAQGGINQGVTKYTAENNSTNYQLDKLFSTSFVISLVASFIVACLMIYFSKELSLKLLKTEEYAYIFIIFSFTIPFFVINQLLLSILNGLKEVRLFIGINITQSIFSLIFTTIMILYFQLAGVLISLVTNQSIILIILIWRLNNHLRIKLSSFTIAFNKAQAINLFKFSVMAITSALCLPLSLLAIREYIGSQLDWEQAGYWQGMWYISSMYLMVVTTTLSVYFLPRFSELDCKKTLFNEMLSGYKVMVPAVIIMAFIIYLLKDIIIKILFTGDFYSMRELFLWQLVGDVVKLCSWLLSYLMLAKAMLKLYLATEIFFTALFLALSFYCVNKFGLVGMSYAYAINYTLYFFTMFLIMKNYFTKR